MRYKPDGQPAMTPAGSVDPAFEIDQVKIPNDGGDW